MLELLTYIAQGATLTEEVKLFVDRPALKQYHDLEIKINNSRNADEVNELELQKAELRESINAAAVLVKLELPTREKRAEILAILSSELKISEEDVEFKRALTAAWIGESITEINFGETVNKGPFTREEMDALRVQLSEVPDNWVKIVTAFNRMASEEVLQDIDMSSPDFS